MDKTLSTPGLYNLEKKVKKVQQQLKANELMIGEGIAQLCLYGYTAERAKALVYQWLEEARSEGGK
jgi:tRNA 2-selenouridine synthase SelU